MSIRISESYVTGMTLRNLQHSVARVVRYQQMAGSLQRILSYADDPRAVGAINRYRQLQAGNEQYLRNAGRARDFVQGTDSALQEMVDVLGQVRELVLRESSALADDMSHDNAIGIVEKAIGNLLNLLNSSVEGNFIFGGHRTDAAPFVRSGDAVIYQGNDGDILAQIGPYTEAVLNIPGSELIGSPQAILQSIVGMALPLTDATNLNSLNLGAGWQAGKIEIQIGDGTQYAIDLVGAGTVGDVLGRINAATGGTVTAAIAADGERLQLTGPGPLTVSEMDDGTAAQSLGLAGFSDEDLLLGQDVRPAPTHRTVLSAIPALQGKLPLGEIIVDIGGVETTVDFSMALTIRDLQTLLQAAVPELDLQIQGGALTIVSQTPRGFAIHDGVGSTAASDLGLVGEASPARLLGVMFSLKAALGAHDKDAIQRTLPELQAVLDNILGQLIKVGDAENVLDRAERHLQERNERLQTGLSRERDADVSRLAVELSRAENAYQATLMVTSRVLETNLWHYLR
jgi:flagellin-like hook-associated protein FlgL